MIKKMRLAAIFILAAICALCICACKKAQAEYSFEGIKDIHVAQGRESYDYEAGVTAFKNLEEADFTVDSSAVKLNTAGKYSLVYKIEKYSKSVDVYVYGEPVFESTSDTVSYGDAGKNTGLVKGLTAKDTFGESLTVSVTKGIPPGANGYIEYGKYTVDYSATDRVGNTKTYSRMLTVSDANKPVFPDMTVDLSDIEKPIGFDAFGGVKIFYNSAELTSASYIFAGGYLSFKESFILPKALGDYQLLMMTAEGYGNMKLTITDDKPATFRLDIADADYGVSVTIPKAELYGNQRNITFDYEIWDANNPSKKFSYTETDEGLTFSPLSSNTLCVKAKAYRGGLEAGEKQTTFKLHDDVYAWTVNSEDSYKDVKFEPEYNVSYTTDRKYGSDTGSTFIENTSATGSGVVLINFYGTADIAVGSSFEFYVYNPTGVALESYIYTTSGWWESLGLNILTNRVEIPATAGWHKVVLTFDLRYDGTLHGMTGLEPYQANTQIRICKTDNWDWDNNDGYFGVNITNVYLLKEADSYSIDYGLGSFIDSGMENAGFILPRASSPDLRVNFEYSLKLGLSDISFDKDALKFTPVDGGDYVFTVKVYFRDRLMETKNINFSISGELDIELFTAAYYTYGNDGIAVLPKATVGGAHIGKTVRYSVKLGSGAETVLGDDMKFNTGKVNGDYTYKAELLEGTTVIATAQKTLKIHGANVLIGLGREASLVNSTLAYDTGTTFTYTTAKAAPGETGSVLINNDGHTFGEKGNINIQLGHTNIANVSMITFWIYHTAAKNLDCVIYSEPSWMFTDYWYNGTRYTNWERAIAPQEGWQMIEVIIGGGHNVGGADIRLQFTSTGYAWTNEPAEIYISNIYYS